MKKILSILIIILPGFAFAPPVLAAGASLSIYPQTGTFTVGNTFEVSVFLNTGGQNVNAVKVELKFDPSKIRVVTPAKGLSLVGNWFFPPSFSNTKGEISLQGGFQGKGINTSEGLVSVIIFEAAAPGKTEVNFLDSSMVLVGEKNGNNVLGSTNRGVYEIIPSPSRGPRVFSETHPDQNKWYKNNSPVFYWEIAAGDQGYSFSFNDDPYGEPDNTIDSQSDSVAFEGAEEGIKFFHIKAKKGQTWGGTSHFQAMIDTTPPSEFTPHLESFGFASGNNLLIFFNTSDSLSGIDHYETRVADFTDQQHAVFSGWSREESPFRLNTEKSGNFRILVRAFDRAGNFREGTIQARVFGSPFIMTGGGVQIKGIFLPWLAIYFLAGIYLLAMAYLIILLKRRRNLRGRLEKEIKEAEKEIEDVREAEERIRKMRILEEESRENYDKLKENFEQITERREDSGSNADSVDSGQPKLP